LSTKTEHRRQQQVREFPLAQASPQLDYISELVLELQRMAAQNGYRSLAAALAVAYAEADRVRDRPQMTYEMRETS
jgi:hypothetical protein